MANNMNTVTASETAHYKEVTTHSRFLQQIFLGLGGATVFGFIGVLSNKLLTSAMLTGEMLPMLGLAGIGVLGVACLYIGAKYMSNTIMMEQDYQARKIGQVARGRAPEVAPTLEVERHRMPTGPMAEQPAAADTVKKEEAPQADTPDTKIRDITAHQKLAADAGLCQSL